ncbi:substrate-binding domain-containing protein [Pseudonocardia sp. GCM10023141]|uniref:substrate-binding domain-containing protein n=1 Tax=Pseudonocardia sp. GCM10023141 TaxID=3252653 RepID=UPI00360EF810
MVGRRPRARPAHGRRRGWVDVAHLGHFAPQFDGGTAAADSALASGATAVVAYNDLIALGLLRAFAARGVAVPARISVLGCDDIPMSAMTHPALSTIALPTIETGRVAVAQLFSMFGWADAAPERVLPTELVLRETTGPPAG